MALLFEPAQKLNPATIFLQPRWDGDDRVYSLPKSQDIPPVRVPPFMSPWDVCEAFMRMGYLPPLEVVRQLHEEEVVMGQVARRLWILRGARQTARLVRDSADAAILQVHQLKQGVRAWR